MSDKTEAFLHSQTRENLMRAFAGESQARNRYTIAAGVANKAGLAVIQGVFLFTAEQERVHAKQFYAALDRCKALGILAPEVAGDTIPAPIADRVFTLGSIL